MINQGVIDLKEFKNPILRKSIAQILNSLVPLIVLFFLMDYFTRTSILLYALTLIIAVGMMLRAFIIQHDCGHGSFFKNNALNNNLGFLLGVLTLTPYRFWKDEHALHHAGSGNLDKRGHGDIFTLTIDEYKRRNIFGKMSYRIYRNPFFLFFIGAPIHFGLIHRLPVYIPLHKKNAWQSIHLTNLVIALTYTALTLTLGFKRWALVYFPTMYFTTVIGTWLFFVQHQFQGTYWERDENWEFKEAAIQSSSYYALPKIIHWFTGNIGYHHIHHLESKIPNYRLKESLKKYPEFKAINKITLLESLSCARYALWDEASKKLITFKRLYRN